MEFHERVQVGVAFRDLGVSGSTSSTSRQHTVVSYLSAIPKFLVHYFTSPEKRRPPILRNFNGSVCSGEMLLVLGRPGSGCSTFLKSLAGEIRGLEIDNASNINYDGITYPQMHHRFKGDCVYLAELDVHFPELTLGQTLTFAAAAREVKSNSKLRPRSTAMAVSSQFNLSDVFDSKVGNAMIRGISGGEKRRTSIAEVFISGAQLQCWDNSTRGLDSRTALGFVQLMRSSTTNTRSTALMSIYQASDAIYENFDKVTLLYEGRQIYFGPATLAAKYFTDLGFERPSRATIADFLTSLTHPEQRMVRKGFENSVPRSAEEFAVTWRRSAAAKALLQEIDESNATYRKKCKVDGRQKTLTYSIPIYVQIWLCTKRGIQRLRNNYVPTVAGVIGNTIISIIVGSVYYNLGEDTDALDKRAVLVFFSLMINAYAPAFEIMAMWAQRPIVEKHNRYALYHPFTESCASLICDLPNKVATCIFFNTTLYFMSNLRRTAGAFFTYMVFMFATILAMSMFFRMVGSLSSTLEQTMVPVSMVILIFSAYTGFIIPVKDMISWLSWLRRLNPIAFAYESLMINEFAGRSFTCSRLIPIGPAYTENSLENKVCAAIGSKPGILDVDGSAFIASKYGFQTAHLWRNIGIILSMLLIFFTIHLIAAEYIAARRSRGEVLLFRGSAQRGNQAEDEETGRWSSGKHVHDQTPIQTTHSHHSKEVVESSNKQSTFQWSDLNYKVKLKNGSRHILKDVEGWVKPGTLTALMGVTGAGKTSLLDILACRARVGIVTGSISLGTQQRVADFQRKTGYVQQEDLHLSTSTVREALEFSAELRHPNENGSSERSHYVQHIIDILDMSSFAEAVVGVPGEGLNVEQRKRLSIAVEMVARPELLLFLDEPTSGLDSQTAWSICTLLRQLSDNGQAILVTIHQPSSQLFQIFDRLLLLDQSGRMLYFGDIGPESSTLIEYFEQNGAAACGSGQNPAEWVLDVTGHADKTETVQTGPDKDWCNIWACSSERKAVLHHLKEFQGTSIDVAGPQHGSRKAEYAASFPRQLRLVVKRVFQEYWRNPMYLYSKGALCAGVTLCNGLSFYNTSHDIQGISNIFFSVFLFTQLFSTLDQQVIPRLTSGRALFEARERRSKTYSWVAMISAHILVELLWQTIAAFIIFVTWWYPTGLWRNQDPSFGTSERSGLAFGMIWLFNLWISTFSQTVGVGMDHEETAVQIATLFFWLSLVFCGVLVPPKDLPRFWEFVYRASPITYFIDGTVVAGLANMPIHCAEIELLHINPPSGQGCGSYLDSFISVAGGSLWNHDATSDCLYCPVSNTTPLLAIYGVEFESRWHNFGYLAVYVLFNVLATFGIYWAFRERKARVHSV
ncbi:pleiotropic drug resistance protein, ABC superfamily [Cucurbitaria berberidis CBS 394.84]|uniref:Pleiotropic drug resistance protein, ABC superfamily n=1 Tax=Cucurbitaria berberidis CBS 394.84 TaxID=1168544 RepID=A0A9P4LD12_9PLEO|nr:pleiotropic drug resistance protein, ABC superfamily [Cucurbitaria berberidis CBS 394.84]KAF1849694.1 pleiotropic drug resistance protein, ABC superfamily [Cucurbitaria berberidis CBS 394.84]